MSDFVHCNRCQTYPPKARFVLGSCFHIFCEKCFNMETNMCLICKKTNKFVAINSSMKSELKAFFMEPEKVIGNEIARLSNKMKFQKIMADHMMEYLRKEKERKKQMELYMKNKAKDFEKKALEMKSMTEWIQMAEKKLKAAEEEIESHKTKIVMLQNELKNATEVPSQHHMDDADEVEEYINPTGLTFNYQEPASELSSIAGSSSQSSFNLISPFARSPNNSAIMDFDNLSRKTYQNQTMNNATALLQTPAPVKEDSNSFSSAFNNMLTPSRAFGSFQSKMAKMDEQSFKKSSEGFDDLNNNGASNDMDTNNDNSLFQRSYSKMNRTSYSFEGGTEYTMSKDASHESTLNLTADEQRIRQRFLEREARFPSPVRALRRYASQPGVVTRRPIIPPSYLDLGNK